VPSNKTVWGAILHKCMVESDSPQITIRSRKDAIYLPDNKGENTDSHT
jgi:hypothetical protein